MLVCGAYPITLAAFSLNHCVVDIHEGIQRAGGGAGMADDNIWKRVLVTGGSGYLGQFLVQALEKENYHVCISIEKVDVHAVCKQLVLTMAPNDCLLHAGYLYPSQHVGTALPRLCSPL